MPISLKSVYGGSGTGVKLGAGITLPDFNDEGIGKYKYTGVDISSGANIVNLVGRWVVYAVSITGMSGVSSNISCTITIDGVVKLDTTQTGYATDTAYIIGGRQPSNVNQVDIANRQGISCDSTFVINMTRVSSTNCTVTLYAYPLE